MKPCCPALPRLHRPCPPGMHAACGQRPASCQAPWQSVLGECQDQLGCGCPAGLRAAETSSGDSRCGWASPGPTCPLHVASRGRAVPWSDVECGGHPQRAGKSGTAWRGRYGNEVGESWTGEKEEEGSRAEDKTTRPGWTRVPRGPRGPHGASVDLAKPLEACNERLH